MVIAMMLRIAMTTMSSTTVNADVPMVLPEGRFGGLDHVVRSAISPLPGAQRITRPSVVVCHTTLPSDGQRMPNSRRFRGLGSRSP